MNDDAERIRQEMQNVRQDMGAGVQDVVQGARQLSDWRYYVRKHPWVCVGSAFALGFLATPARRRILSGNLDVASLVQQLKGGVATGAPMLPGGVAGRILAFVGPIILQNAAAFVAQRFAPHDPSPAAEPADPTVDAP